LKELFVTTDSEFVDHYEILEASCNASFETIESVFRFLAKRFHPDSGETGDRERFKEIVEAYETLRDPERRSAYDEVFQSEKTSDAILRSASSRHEETRDRNFDAGTHGGH
jgi:curved DNA-binding protein CbpA